MTSFSKHPDKFLVTFLSKTLFILDNPLYESIISWDPTGRMIVIKNQPAFQEEILAKQFKHKNIKSFVRQLNMYGFKKVKKGIAKNSFYHPYFVRGSKDEMALIRRRKNCKSMDEENMPPFEHKIESISKKNIKSEQTIITNQTQSDPTTRIFQQPSVKDIIVQQYNPSSFYEINPWNCLNQDVFQYQDSYQYPMLPSQ